MIKPSARARQLKKRFGATAMVSGGYGFGQIGARFAAAACYRLGTPAWHQRRYHWARSTHIGRLGEYTQMIAAEWIDRHLFYQRNHVQWLGRAITAGAKKSLAQTRCPLPCLVTMRVLCLLDFATAGVAHGKVVLAQARKARRYRWA